MDDVKTLNSQHQDGGRNIKDESHAKDTKNVHDSDGKNQYEQDQMNRNKAKHGQDQQVGNKDQTIPSVQK